MHTDKGQFYSRVDFTPYFYAHVVYNVTKHPGAFLRHLEEFFGDANGEMLARSYPKYTSLHWIIDAVVRSYFFDVEEEGRPTAYYFLKHIGLDHLIHDPSSIDEIVDIEDHRQYESAFDDLVDEVFHILFYNVNLMESLNAMTAQFLEQWATSLGHGDGRLTQKGTLRRTKIPQYAKDIVYFRDQGKCRSCKVAIDRILEPTSKECFDHIVPLNQFGSNDITNLQLLCSPCNLSKSDRAIPVSRLYPKQISW
jgi:HNH endonuclease